MMGESTPIQARLRGPASDAVSDRGDDIGADRSRTRLAVTHGALVIALHLPSHLNPMQPHCWANDQ